MTAMPTRQPVIEARGLIKTFGSVVGLDAADFDLYPGEVLAVIGDNGAGKSTLIKCLSGATIPDAGEILVEGQLVTFRRPQDARAAGIETVYQSLAVVPALDIASNMFLGREIRRRGPLGSILRMLDHGQMRATAKQQLLALGIGTLQEITQAVAVARAAAFGSKVIILDEPTASLGVRETGQVLKLIRDLRDRGLPVVLISHNMPNVFEVADRIHIQRLGRRVAVVTPTSHSPSQAVAIMTGAMEGAAGLAASA